MNEPPIQFIPASLIRVRCFMNTTGRLKVKPWASAEETLDAFHDMLQRQRDNDAFWKDLEGLLASLTRDIKKRLSGNVPDNELLDATRHGALLSEIRSALAASKGQPTGFRRLASALSAPAVAMLLLLGGTTTVGCDNTARLQGTADATSDPTPEPDTDPVSDPPPDYCAEVLADITVNDAPCDVEMEGEECLHACKSFEEIVVECVPEDSTSLHGGDARCKYIDCIQTMHESWRTGLTELFACWDCRTIEHKLSCDLDSFCRYPDDSEFDLETFLDACHCCIYVGVRFE